MKILYACLIALLLSNSAITVNAATATLNPTADAHVQAGTNASKNYGTLTSLRVRTSTTTASNYDSYLKFDTSSVVGSISNVKLRLYAALSASGTLSTTAFAVPTTTWTETGITWNNKPVRGVSLGSVVVNSTAYAYKDIDVTSYVQSEAAAGRKVVSFAYHNAANSSILITANSKEATNKPQLLITYSTNTPPTVSLSSPASSYVAPASITLNATAADIDGNATITKVEFFNGTALLNTDTTAPYAYTWSNVPAGSYTLTAKVTDNANASTTSSPLSITVTANTPPTVSLLAPNATDDFTAPATFSLVANATDSDGIAKVEFYNGASLLGTSTQSPYQYDWANVPAGSYSLSAKATDNANASATSSAVSIVVKAAPAPPGIYYIFADHLNTARVITDTANTTVWSWNSDPFGTDVAQEDPDGDGRRFTYNHRFPGQYFDRETGLHQNYFRDYESATGRYIQSDPLGLAGGSFSTYSYANQNPLSFVDPLGLYEIVVNDSGGRNGATYGGTITVTGDNGRSVTVPASSWPNPTNANPGVTTGTFPGTYSPTGHQGRTNGVRVNNGGRVPTLGPNPAQNGQNFSTGINIHCGYRNNRRGSAGCITIDPAYCQQVWDVLQPGETGNTTINR